MIDVADFVEKLLKKKGWGYIRFASEINKVRKEAGIEGITRKQNIYSRLKSKERPLSYKTLVVWEKALGLKDDTLCNMVNYPTTLGTRKELEKFKKRVRK